MSSLPAAGVAGPLVHRRMPAAVSLGRVEGRKLLRHPATVLGAMGSIVLPVIASVRNVPVLNRWDTLTNEALIPFAIGALIAAQLGMMRAHRNGTIELFTSAPAGRGSVVGAYLIAVLESGIAASIIVLVQLMYLKVIGGVTAPRLNVLLLGPALVLFSGAVGVAVGTWAPRLFAAPVALSGLVVVCYALSTNSYVHNREWLSLWVPSEVLQGVASEATLRPYAWRLPYLLGLAVVAALVAMWRIRRVRPATAVAMMLALAVVVVAGAHLTRTVTRKQQAVLAARLIDKLEHPNCSEISGVEYCPFDGYGPWIDIWRAPTEGVIAAAPTGAAPAELRFLQAPSANDVYDERTNILVGRTLERERKSGLLAVESDVRPPLSWGRSSTEQRNELAIALEVASRVTGIDSHFRLTKEDIRKIPQRYRHQFNPALYRSCSTLDQGRSIVAMWLAAQATPATRSAFLDALRVAPYLPDRRDRKNSYFALYQSILNSYAWETVGENAVMWGTRESAYALELLKRDPATVKSLLVSNWDRLTDPATTTDETARLLGLAPLPDLKTAMEEWHVKGRVGAVNSQGSPACR